MSEVKYVDSKALNEFLRLLRQEIGLTNTMLKSQIIDSIYPIGSIYMSFSQTNPADLFGGKWQQIKGQFLLAADETHQVNNTGDGKLKEEQLPQISGTIGAGVGVAKPSGGELGDYGIFRNASGHFSFVDGTAAKYTYDRSDKSTIGNPQPYQQVCYSFGKTKSEQLPVYPPYVSVYMWKRTA